MKKDKLKLRAEILREIFDFAPKMYKDEYSAEHPLAKSFGISNEELKNNLDFLFSLHLIEKSIPKDKGSPFDWVITQKGFDYLEEKNNRENQAHTQKLILFFTGILAISSMAPFIIKIQPNAEGQISTAFFIIYVAILITVGITLFKEVFK